ncbi:cell division protein FtsQ/DivIB [Hyphococcus flavus]|uniref:Cell division protein FtsQ n=1 Tax=Hyphococcus flavus TaxID=1866326 RepID=A0AAE9ZA52_9PROT|nr:cell division protein FtsQ/DivIB [Hyphococcus flavus]WDI30399.1 cell division protein FtsQ/DivIB [Hyphococcus flavus]
MPKMKKKATRKKSSRKKELTFFDRIATIWTRFSYAALASSVLLAIVAVGFLWAGGYFGLAGEQLNRFAGERAVSAGLEIERITARGMSRASEEEILNAIGPVIGSSIMHFDADRARAAVEQIGWVRVAAVSRLFPNTVHVSVREREPAAVWQLSGDLHLIDGEGAVIREVNAYEYADLPLIVGAGAPGAASDMLKALQAEPLLWGRASALIRVSDRRWNLKTREGIDIKFPETGERAAVRYLARLQDETRLLDDMLEYIDLRNPDYFVYRRKGGASNEQPLGRLKNEAL